MPRRYVDLPSCHIYPKGLERLAKAERGPTECWIWDGPIVSGYGSVSVKEGNRLTCVMAHRLSYFLKKGSIPSGLELDHLCRNRLCVNPAHLEPVTSRENVLRSGGVASKNAAKTHCPCGHPYYTTKRGWRHCQRCRALQQRNRRRDKATGVPVPETLAKHVYKQKYT